jgi:hypothetical protein
MTSKMNLSDREKVLSFMDSIDELLNERIDEQKRVYMNDFNFDIDNDNDLSPSATS